MAEKLTPEQQAILDEANSRGSLVDNHPDLKGRDAEAPTPTVIPRSIYFPDGKPESDPRTMGPQPKAAQSGYGDGKTEGTVDDAEWLKQHWGHGNKGSV